MGPLANFFRRSDSSPSNSKKQQHTTLDVPLPSSPFHLIVDNSRTDDAGASPPLERRFGPRLPREASSGTSAGAIRSEPAGFSGPPTLARSGQGYLMVAPSGRSDVLAQRVEALSLGGGDERVTSSSGAAAFASSNSALPGQSRPLVPFTSAVRALRVSSGPSTTTAFLPPEHHQPPPPPPDSRVHLGLPHTAQSCTAATPPAVPSRPPASSPFSGTDASRQPFAPGPPTPPRRRPLPSSQSAPVLPGRVGQPVTSRAPGERGAGLAPPLDVAPPMQFGFAYSDGSAAALSLPYIHPSQQETPRPRNSSSSKPFPAAQPHLSLPDENKLPPPHTIIRTTHRASPLPSDLSKPAPTTPIRKAPRRASEPARTFNSPASARSSPASSRRGAKSSGQSRQCDGITALSKRCTRTVSLAGWTVPADGVEVARPDQLAGEGGDGGPVYCKQHAKLALVNSGCFVTVKTEGGVSEERWITFSDWIDADLPIETQALLRHYMSKPVSRRDQEGYIYVHELVPRGDRGFSRSAPLDSTAHIKLGRTVKPVARLSQWRANCPSREPIVRFVFPRAPRHGPMQFAARGTRNHHRWERLCLVELAGRAIPAAEEKCADCGARHVECFRVERSAVAEVASGRWDVVQVVEKWERWCRDMLG